MEIPKAKRVDRTILKREKVGGELSQIAQKMAELKEAERLKRREYEESENLCIIEVVKSFNLTADTLQQILSSNVQLIDNPANSTIPAQSVQAVIDTVPRKNTKEKEYDEEID
jgi:hypothetical protein